MSIVPTQKFRFLGGEVSPILYDSADMDQYGRWFSVAENIRFDTLGAFKNRTGFEKVHILGNENSVIKLIRFNISREQSYLIEIGTDYFHFYQDGHIIHVGGDEQAEIYSVSHDMVVSANKEIKYVQIGDVIYLVDGSPKIGMLTRNDSTGYNWTFSNFSYKNSLPPLGNLNTDDTKKLTITNNNSVYNVQSPGFNFFENLKAGDIFAVNLDIPAEETSWIYGAEPSVVGHTSETILTNGRFTLSTTGNWGNNAIATGGQFVLEYSFDKTNWVTFYTVSSYEEGNPHNVNIAGNVLESDDNYDAVFLRAKITQPFTYGNHPLQIFLAGERFFVKAYFRVQNKVSDSEANCQSIRSGYVIKNAASATSSEWQTEIFNESFGYPDVIGFYQNRLLLGADYLIYGSKTNEYDNFHTPVKLSADDPISMSLLSTKYNKIKNLLTIRKFFVFTDEGEFGIQSQGALTQTDKNLLPISYHGSNDCLPVLSGNLALFVDYSGKCVRLFQYSYETDAFEANDASVLISKLLEKNNIITTDYLKNTKEALFLDDSGTIWVFKLMPEQEIYCWSHLKYAGSGKITNICVVPNGSEEDLYIAIWDENLGEKRIELLSKDKYYDSEKIYTSSVNKTMYYTDYTQGTYLIVESGGDTYKIKVGANGLVVLPKASTEIKCHYAYTATATLLAPVQNLTENVFTTYNKGKPFKVYFAYQDSYGFKVGVEENEKMSVRFTNGDRPETKDITTGKRNVLIPSRYDGSGKVSFVQDRPYNMTINNIMIDMDYGGK